MVATEVLLLVHVPPETALLSNVVLPTHTAVPPVMAAGDVVTVTTVVTLQPVPSE
jgi:hypothetical protein